MNSPLSGADAACPPSRTKRVYAIFPVSMKIDTRRPRRTAANSFAGLSSAAILFAVSLLITGAPATLAQSTPPAPMSPAVPGTLPLPAPQAAPQAAPPDAPADDPALATSPTAPEPGISAPPPAIAAVTLPPTPLALPPLATPLPAPPKPRPPVVTSKPPPRPPIRKPLPPRPVVTENTVVYGRSSQGRPLTAFVLDNGHGPAADTTLIFGGFHGNERTTPAVVGRLREYLKQKPTDWSGRRVVLIPYANPDGWRAGTRVNARDVDLNRNFPAEWSCTGIAARNNPGPAPASEPETRAMIHLLNLERPAKIVSLHSPLHCLNWTGPLGLAMAEAMARHDHYRPTAHIGYSTPGSLGDYCGARGIGIVTLELPAESESASWAANRDALLAAIQLRLHTP